MPSVPQEWPDLFRLIPGYDPVATAGDAWFEGAAADRAVGFIEDSIAHVEGDKAGSLFKLEPWQKAVVGCLFGWKRKDLLGRTVRRYRECLLYVSRKNGKTPLAAAIALLVFFLDPESGQQDYIAAADREQAGMLFRQAKGMVNARPALGRRCRIYGGNASAGQSRSIVKDDNSFLRVVSADADTKHGGTSHLVIVDELHAQPSRDLVDVLTTSTASLNRKQPLTIYLTTADYARPSICNEKHEYATKVRDGIIEDPSFLPVVYEAPRDADWADPAVWAQANPNLGVSVSLEYLTRECKRAQEIPAYENTFRRLHLNQVTETDVRAIPMDRWDAVKDPVDPAALEGRECWGGLDLSTTTDLSAFVLVFPDGEGGYDVLPHFWAPKESARARERRDRVPYSLWERQGHLKLTAGDVIDYDVIRADINLLRERYNVREVAADRWNATQIINQLQGDGFEVVAYGQGFKDMTAPTKELLKLVAAGKLRHGGQPVLRWMAGNMATESDAAGNLKPSKKKSTERIDGLVAAVMAIGRAMLRDEAGSVYETRGVDVLTAPAARRSWEEDEDD